MTVAQLVAAAIIVPSLTAQSAHFSSSLQHSVHLTERRLNAKYSSRKPLSCQIAHLRNLLEYRSEAANTQKNILLFTF